MGKDKDFLLQIVSMLVFAGCLYGTMNNKIGTVEARADQLETKLEKYNDVLIKIDKSLSDIARDIWWIKKTLKKD